MLHPCCQVALSFGKLLRIWDHALFYPRANRIEELRFGPHRLCLSLKGQMHHRETWCWLSEVEQNVVTILAKADGCDRPTEQNVSGAQLAWQLLLCL